jgi:hypothetical protein
MDGEIGVDDEDLLIPGLPASVRAQIRAELPGGTRVLRALATANKLLELADELPPPLRVVESAAYNLREALDAVSPSPGPSGLTDILESFRRFQAAGRLPSEQEVAHHELLAVLAEVASDERRHGARSQDLVRRLADRSGVEPARRTGDVISSYARLRDEVNAWLHGNADRAQVDRAYGATISWFISVFTPPDDRVRRLVAVGSAPLTPEHAAEATSLLIDRHHVRVFLSNLTDPAWLTHLYEHELLPPVERNEPWVVSVLADRPPRVDPVAVANLLARFMDDARSLPDDDRLVAWAEIIRQAWRLGPPGYPLVEEIVRAYPRDSWVRSIATHAVDGADPGAHLVEVAFDALVGNDAAVGYNDLTDRLASALVAGINPENVADRIACLAAKVRRLAEGRRFVHLDPKGLLEPIDGYAGDLAVLSHHLATAITSATEIGHTIDQLLAAVDGVPGEIGDRIRCIVFATCRDLDRNAAVDHLAARVQCGTITGDDQRLLIALGPLTADEVHVIAAAVGEPDPGSSDDWGGNWRAAWRWSSLLPAAVFAKWTDALVHVEQKWGSPDPAALFDRPPPVAAWGSSPHTVDELEALDLVDALKTIASWRPDPNGPWGASARELARTLEACVATNPERWLADPTGAVATLREPVFIDHYLRGAAKAAGASPDRLPGLLEAVHLVRKHRWTPTVLGSDDFDYEPTWEGVDMAAIKLIEAHADANSPLHECLHTCWDLTEAQLHRAIASPPDWGNADSGLDRAINTDHGSTLECVLSLGAWEHRNLGAASPRLTIALDTALSTSGHVGEDLRAVLAASRPLLEVIARAWMEAKEKSLFGADDAGRAAIKETLKYSRPTPPFLEHHFDDLAREAIAGTDNAIAWLLVGHLNDEPGYTAERIVRTLTGQEAALRTAASEMARLANSIEPSDPMFARARSFALHLLDSAGTVVPTRSLAGNGRWALNDSLDNETWITITDRTLKITNGTIDYPVEVAQRASQMTTPRAVDIFDKMLGHGEPWERHAVEDAAIALLRNLGHMATVPGHRALRDRLIHRGRTDLVDEDLN